MATAAQITTWLTEAETARHQLATGQLITEVWRDGRRIIYAGMTLAALESYIATLRTDLAAATAAEAGRPRRTAIGIVY